MDMIPLDGLDLVLPALLVVANGALSVALHLGLHRQFVIAAVRMVVQLWLLGLVLTVLFERVSPLWTGLAALVMLLFAGREVMARQERQLAGFWSFGLGTGSMVLTAPLITVLALMVPLGVEPWYEPRYALPLLGMILGNTMTGVALGLQTLTTGLVRDRAAVEAQLALGATRYTALLPATRTALRTAMIPIVNSMAATGVVSIPGMMTGQILAGAPPAQAANYQILIIFLIAGGTAFGAVAAVLGAGYRLTDSRHRLRLDRVTDFREN